MPRVCRNLPYCQTLLGDARCQLGATLANCGREAPRDVPAAHFGNKQLDKASGVFGLRGRAEGDQQPAMILGEHRGLGSPGYVRAGAAHELSGVGFLDVKGVGDVTMPHSGLRLSCQQAWG